MEMIMRSICTRCGRNASPWWWKCCPYHTSEQGPDVVCYNCTEILHPEFFEDGAVVIEVEGVELQPEGD